MADDETPTPARELVGVVLLEAVGSSVTPFVPLPFVDDYLMARLLRRISKKVLTRRGAPAPEPLAKIVVEGYTRAGESPLGERAVVAAARFVVRKVAVVLDVKKSHDVFGEAIAYALALDVAVEHRAVHDASAHAVGGALFRAVDAVGSAPLELLTQATRTAFAATDPPGSNENATRLSRISRAVGRQVDEVHGHLAAATRRELLAARLIG